MVTLTKVKTVEVQFNLQLIINSFIWPINYSIRSIINSTVHIRILRLRLNRLLPERIVAAQAAAHERIPGRHNGSGGRLLRQLPRSRRPGRRLLRILMRRRRRTCRQRGLHRSVTGGRTAQLTVEQTVALRL